MNATLRPLVLVPLVLLGLACGDPTASLDPPPPADELNLLAIIDPDRTRQHVLVQPLSQDIPLTDVSARLYENGSLVAEDHLAGSGLADDTGRVAISRCASTFGGVVVLRGGVCAEFDWWPRYGATYHVEVEAPGFRDASGETTVPAFFRVTDVSASGVPPGTGELDVQWETAKGVHTYVVAVRAEATDCFGSGCETGWFTETDSTAFSGTVPDDRFADGDPPFVVEVAALNRALYEYLTTGAGGGLFAVPPVQNVEGGHGVVGAWVRRTSHQFDGGQWRPDPVVFRGSWTTVPGPDAFIFRKVISNGDAGKILVLSPTAVYRSDDGGAQWRTSFQGDHFTTLLDTRSGVYASARDTLFQFTPGSASEWTPLADLGDAVVNLLVSDRDGLIVARLNQTPSRLLRSDDGGATFDTVALPALDRETGIVALAEDPGSGTLYAGLTYFNHTGPPEGPPVLRSHDRGLTWEPGAANLPWDAIQITAGPGRLYALIQNIEPGVYVSDDRGDSWTRATHRVPTDVVAESTGDHVWVGLRFNEDATTDAPGGVLFSDDGGETFIELALNALHVTALDLNEEVGQIYALTEQLGILRRVLPRDVAVP